MLWRVVESVFLCPCTPFGHQGILCVTDHFPVQMYRGFRQFLTDWKFRREKVISKRDTHLGIMERGGKYTKFDVNRTNIKWVTTKVWFSIRVIMKIISRFSRTSRDLGNPSVGESSMLSGLRSQVSGPRSQVQVSGTPWPKTWPELCFSGHPDLRPYLSVMCVCCQSKND